MISDRLRKQLEFAVEVDKLKQVYRQTYLIDGSRRENDAEHSWNLGLLVLVLSEHAAESELDVLRTMQMVLIHDLVEIDAGDTYCYDTKGNEGKLDRERQAADRIFGLLPPDQTTFLWELWEEFEARKTPEAKFAAALDRLQPLLCNYHTQGRSWQEHGVHRDQVLERNRHIGEGAPELWEYVEEMLAAAVAESYLPE